MRRVNMLALACLGLAVATSAKAAPPQQSMGAASILLATPPAADAEMPPPFSVELRKRAPKGLTKEFYACVEKRAEQSTIEYENCEGDEVSRQDARLNRIYRELIAILKGQSKNDLIESERAWLRMKSEEESLESLLYTREQVDSAQQEENKMFRICERANTLQMWLDLAKDG